MAPVRRPLLLLPVEPVEGAVIVGTDASDAEDDRVEADDGGRATITMPGSGQVVKTESKGKGNKRIRLEVVDA